MCIMSYHKLVLENCFVLETSNHGRDTVAVAGGVGFTFALYSGSRVFQFWLVGQYFGHHTLLTRWDSKLLVLSTISKKVS